MKSTCGGLFIISLLCGTKWMEEAIWWWCWGTPLPLLPGYWRDSRTRNDWSNRCVESFTIWTGFFKKLLIVRRLREEAESKTGQKEAANFFLPVTLWNMSSTELRFFSYFHTNASIKISLYTFNRYYLNVADVRKVLKSNFPWTASHCKTPFCLIWDVLMVMV